jgi:hypothetical protein
MPCATPSAAGVVCSSAGHGHPVPAQAGKRDADEHVIHRAVGLVRGADSEPGGQRPVDLHVAEPVLLVERAALERQAEPHADDAVRAVATDKIAGPDPLGSGPAAQFRGHAVVVLGDRDQFDAPIRDGAEVGQALCEHPLGLVLRERREPERHVRRQRHLDRGHQLAVAVHILPAHRDGRVQRGGQYPGRLPELQRPGLHADSLRVMLRLVEAVDDPAAHTSTPQLQRSSETDRASTDDEHVHVRHVKPPGSVYSLSLGPGPPDVATEPIAGRSSADRFTGARREP